jgi:hypothetical protein
MMQIQVVGDTGPDGVVVPRECAFDGKHVEVAELLDQWHGVGHRYVKFRGTDDNLYIVRRDDARGTWELTMYETPRGHEVWEQKGSVRPRTQGNGAAED